MEGSFARKEGGNMPRYVEAKVQKHASVQCEHCGRQYGYTYVGKSTSDVRLLEFS